MGGRCRLKSGSVRIPMKNQNRMRIDGKPRQSADDVSMLLREIFSSSSSRSLLYYRGEQLKHAQRPHHTYIFYQILWSYIVPITHIWYVIIVFVGEESEEIHHFRLDEAVGLHTCVQPLSSLRVSLSSSSSHVFCY